jgi:hypothetical protein
MNESQSRWSDIADVITRLLVATAGAAVALGLLAAIIAWATGRDVSRTMAATYYIVGCVLFLVGTFPTGGFSLMRGTVTRRSPIGASTRQDPVYLAGILLIGVGVVVDVFRPF